LKQANFFLKGWKYQIHRHSYLSYHCFVMQTFIASTDSFDINTRSIHQCAFSTAEKMANFYSN
jgi:hypothetical protein